MAAVIRLFTTLLVLIGLSASVAGPEVQAAPDAGDTRASMPATHDCAQSMFAAIDGDETEIPNCPSAPMAAGACGGTVAVPVESCSQLQAYSAADPLDVGVEHAWDLLLVIPFFRPPIV